MVEAHGTAPCYPVLQTGAMTSPAQPPMWQAQKESDFPAEFWRLCRPPDRLGPKMEAGVEIASTTATVMSRAATLVVPAVKVVLGRGNAPR